MQAVIRVARKPANSAWSSGKPARPDIGAIHTRAWCRSASASTAQAEQLADLLRKHLARPETVKALAEIGIDPVLDTPEDLSASLSREFSMWREVVEKVGLKRA